MGLGPVHALSGGMSFPVEVRFRDMASSPALDQFVRRWAAKLGRVHERIARCDVVIERPHQHQRHGQHVHVRVSLGVPGPDIVVTYDQPLDGAHEDAYVAVRDAFRAARRQLEQHARHVRGAEQELPW